MCLGFAATVLSLDKELALIDMHGVKRKVSVELLNDVKKGDQVMVHAGVAISKIDEKKQTDIYKEIL